MTRFLLTAALLLAPAIGLAQSEMQPGSSKTMANGAMMMPQGMTMQQGMTPATEPGQGAFAAIAEIVAALEADPETDWTSVDIATLREHLRDMAVVMIDSVAVAEDVDGGIRFTVTGAPNVSPSIARMVLGHAAVMQDVNDWQYDADRIDRGAVLTVLVPEKDRAKIKALGFYGVLTSGVHHQPHHWMMATGG